MAKKRTIKKSRVRFVVFGIPSIIAIIVFLITFITHIYNYNSLKKEEKKLNNELYTLREEKKNLKTEIQKLNDPDYIVRFAKEKYLYSQDGEYVIKIDENKKIVEEEDDNSYVIYGILGAIGFVLCLLFIKRKTT